MVFSYCQDHTSSLTCAVYTVHIIALINMFTAMDCEGDWRLASTSQFTITSCSVFLSWCMIYMAVLWFDNIMLRCLSSCDVHMPAGMGDLEFVSLFLSLLAIRAFSMPLTKAVQ